MKEWQINKFQLEIFVVAKMQMFLELYSKGLFKNSNFWRNTFEKNITIVVVFFYLCQINRR